MLLPATREFYQSIEGSRHWREIKGLQKSAEFLHVTDSKFVETEQLFATGFNSLVEQCTFDCGEKL